VNPANVAFGAIAAFLGITVAQAVQVRWQGFCGEGGVEQLTGSIT
jgi:hypothetical protein